VRARGLHDFLANHGFGRPGAHPGRIRQQAARRETNEIWNRSQPKVMKENVWDLPLRSLCALWLKLYSTANERQSTRMGKGKRLLTSSPTTNQISFVQFVSHCMVFISSHAGLGLLKRPRTTEIEIRRPKTEDRGWQMARAKLAA